MKLEEMADVLDGLATALEKCLGKTAVSDFHALSACLRQFAGESVAAFCKFTVQAHEGNSHAPRGAAGVNEGKVQELVGRIKHFLDDRRGTDYAAIRQMVADDAVHLDQTQLRDDFFVRTQIVQQPNQDQLRIRLRIDPQFDPLASRAELDQSEALSTDLSATPPVEKVQPIRDRGIAFR